jgi:hypothetical protein
MKHLYFILLTVFLSTSVPAVAGNTVNSKQIAGSWKITDVKTSKIPAGAKVTGCYLCDLYEHDAKLVFTESGTVAYEGNRNPTTVYYKINNDELIFYTNNNNAPAQNWAKAVGDENSVSFKISYSDNKLVLVKTSGQETETYTLTK